MIAALTCRPSGALSSPSRSVGIMTQPRFSHRTRPAQNPSYVRHARTSAPFPRTAIVVASFKGSKVAASSVEDESGVADTLRAAPLAAGAVGILATLGNRIFSGIAPVVDASSSQSRADVLVIALSAVLVLTGLQWLSLKPKTPVAVELSGTQYDFVAEGLPAAAAAELNWAHQSLTEASGVKAVVVMHRGQCVFHRGAGRSGATPGSAEPGEMCQRVMESGRGNYIANLTPYPGRFEFFGYLPSNTQAIILQPLGTEGLMVAATDAPRSFTSIDQAWISTLAEKIEVTLSEDGSDGSSSTTQ